MMPSLIKLLVLFTAVSVALANPWPPSVQDSCNWLKAWCTDCQNSSCGNITSHKQSVNSPPPLLSPYPNISYHPFSYRSRQKLCFKTHCESHHPHHYPRPCKQWQMADKCMRSCQWKRSYNLTLSWNPFMNHDKCRHCCDMQGGPTEKRMRRSGY
ncbi:BZ3500_MvSof-1268-A1-R1_Chr5-1g07600 [Microbotryum saponariae]|uniref:BZ3500_MvSof-1268-A1-R1_Chr5-1g07600 protein n=1 Tax=Microbotryum saponariae TaxID=289078 RepID=A0A2X0KJ30_9BASI|nr:BZ3500_MvSof-1268-A1-R1_Chr5-1g07600 [Microbotryum saponariae]SDA05471.1 BZ3501_MvSof-1269-A2-R1_Chr5-2g07424 [Microbotryum saponariae]